MPLQRMLRGRELTGIGEDPMAPGEFQGHFDGMNPRNKPLMMAASAGRNQTVTDLLDQGADIHAADESGQQDAPLLEACQAGQTDTVRLLLDRGADLHTQNDAPLKFLDPRVRGFSQNLNRNQRVVRNVPSRSHFDSSVAFQGL